jgi:hypothetical protein
MATESVSGTFKDRGDLTPDTSCKVWFRCNADAGLTNQIAGGDDGAANTALATAGTMLTTKSGFATTILDAGQTGSFDVASANIAWDKNASSKQSLIVHMRVIGAAPVANNYLMSSYPNAGGSGIRIQALTTGAANAAINDTTTGEVASGAGTTEAVLDGSEHSMTIIVDANNDMMTTYVDGLPAKVAYSIDVSSVTGDTDASTYAYHFGSNAAGGTSIPISYREIQIYTPTDLPADQGRLAGKLHSRPFTPLTSTDMGAKSVKRVQLAIVGQSNERGRRREQGDDTKTGWTTTKIGQGQSDPIKPKGGTGSATLDGSMWPRLIDRMADERNITLNVYNTGVGSTGIVKSWCGDASGLGTGTPYASGDIGFDPNSYFADVTTGASVGTFDERWCLISLGQEDASDGVSAANYQLGIENATNYLLDQGFKVAIGFTCFQTGGEAWFAAASDAVDAAIATFSDNPNVIAGANLYKTLGVGVGLYDGNHMDANAYDDASDDWFDVFNGAW